MTLDDIAALEALWAEANQDTPWHTFEDKDGSEGVIHLCDDDGAPLAWLPADDAGRCNGLLIANVANALPALLALARRGLEADEGPNEHEVCAMAAAECDLLADEYESAGSPPAAEACRECGDRIEEMDTRTLFEAAPVAAGVTP